MGYLAGFDQALDGDLHGRRVERQRGFDDTTAPRRSDQEASDYLVRPAGRRQAHPAWVAHGLRRHPLERDGQVRTPLGRCQCVDFINDQVFDGPPVLLPAFLAQE